MKQLAKRSLVILAHQIVFANATPKQPALDFTMLGEPAPEPKATE